MNNLFGKREIDRAYNWSIGNTVYGGKPVSYYRGIFDKIRAQKEDPTRLIDQVPDTITLNQSQRRVVDFVMNHIGDDGQLTKQFTLLVQGGAGCGKSVALRSVAQLLLNRNIKFNVAAPTGSAADNTKCGAYTLHALLGLSIYTPMEVALNYPPSKNTINRFRGTLVLLLDEFFMIPPQLLQILLRKVEYMKTNNMLDAKFSFVFMGDIHQMKPPFSGTIYAKKNLGYNPNADAIMFYKRIEDVIILNENCRQKEDTAFFNALKEVAVGKMAIQTIQLLNARNSSNLDEEEKSRFMESGTGIFPYRELVYLNNLEALKQRSLPVIKCNTINLYRREPISMSWDLSILLGPNVRVQLTTNLAVKYGLVNGSQGTVKHLYFAKRDLKKDPSEFPNPVFVTVQFPGYKGPHTLDDGTIPIFPIMAAAPDEYRETTMKVEGFPLILSYNITNCKSQGQTLEKAKIFTGRFPDVTGVLYTCLSRVRSIKDIIIEGELLHENYFNSTMDTDRQSEIRRLEKLDKLVKNEQYDE